MNARQIIAIIISILIIGVSLLPILFTVTVYDNWNRLGHPYFNHVWWFPIAGLTVSGVILLMTFKRNKISIECGTDATTRENRSLQGDRMKSSIKRVIAREGLILISLLLLFGTFQALDYWQSHRITPHLDLGTSKLVPPQDLPKELQQENSIPRKGLTEGKWVDVDIFDKIPDVELYNAAGIPIKDRPLIYQINFSLISAFFLIVAYPLYWLIRFTVWAIKTVRRKEATI